MARHRRPRGLGYPPQEHAARAATARNTMREAAIAAAGAARGGDCLSALKLLVDAARAQGVYVVHTGQANDTVVASSLEMDRAVAAIDACHDGAFRG